MKNREPVLVEVAELATDGCGYSSDNRHAVYGALPGETVLAQPVARKRKRLYGRAVEVNNPSPDRVTPACSAAAFCGGCSFQHLAHEGQLALKQSLLENELAETRPETFHPPLTHGQLGYRTKARLGVKYVHKKEAVLVGFREKQKPFIAETNTCPILMPPADELIEPLKQLITSLSIREKVPQIELSMGDQDIALIFRHLEAPSDDDLAIFREFAETHCLQLYLQPGKPESTHLLHDGAKNGAGLSYALPEFDLEFDFEPHDFTQVNLPLNRKMVMRALELLDLNEDDRVMDAFCGIGNFSLALARHCREVRAYEAAEPSVARARLNAAKNHITNAHFGVQDLYQGDLQGIDFSGINKVLLDPPRSGGEEFVKVLARHDVERVVYVSCNPATLARDVKTLVNEGFKLRTAGIIDMFPHTTHVESIALITRD